MASVLKSFLIAIGIDSTEATKGARTVERSIGGIKSSALQAGAALVGVFGAKALTADFARRVDTLNLAAKALDVNTSAVQALGNAFAITGGDADSALGVLQKLTQARDALAVKGDAGFLTDAAFSGIDPSLIKDAENSYDALLNIVEQFPNLSSAQQRTLAETLGIGPAELNLFKSGRATLEGHISTLEKIRPVTEKAVEESRRLRGEFSLLQTQIGGVADTVSVPLIGALADATEYANKFIDANRPLIDGTVGKGIEIASDNFTALAVAVGGIAAAGTLGTIGALARYIPGIGAGLGTIATNLSKVGGIAAAAGVSSIVADVADKTLAENVPGYQDFDAKLTRGIYDLTGFDLSRGNVNEGTERKSLNPWADIKTPYGDASEAASSERSKWWNEAMTPSTVPREISDPMGYGETARRFMQSSEQSEQPSTTPTIPQRLPPVQVQLQLDGRIIDERIIDVTERTASAAMEDIITTTKR